MTLLNKLKNSKIGSGIRKVLPYLAIPLIIAGSVKYAQAQNKLTKESTRIGLSVSSNLYGGLNYSEPLFDFSIDDSTKGTLYLDLCGSFPLRSPKATTEEVESPYTERNFNGSELPVPKGAIENIKENPLFKLGLSGVITNYKGREIGIGGGFQIAHKQVNIDYNGQTVPENAQTSSRYDKGFCKPYTRIWTGHGKNLNIFWDINWGSEKKKRSTTVDLGATFTFPLN